MYSFEQSLPHDEDAEKGVLGSMILSEDAIYIAEDMLIPEDFYFKHHAIIFETITKMHEDKEDIDALTLSTNLQDTELDDLYKSLTFLKDSFGIITSSNIKSYVKIVKDKAKRRKVIKTLSNNLSRCYVEDESIESLIENIEDDFSSLSVKSSDDDFKDLSEALDEVKKLSQLASTGNIDAIGIPSGFTDLDNVFKFFQNGLMTIVAGRPGTGKTVFALNIALNVATNLNKSVAIFSLEMDSVSLARRLIASKGHIDSTKIIQGEMSDEEWEEFNKTSDELKKAKIYVDDVVTTTTGELRAKCRKAKQKYKAELIIIDYLTLIDGSNNYKVESKQQEVSQISKTIRIIAKQLNIPVIVLSQLSRECEKRADKRPMMSDLRDSGSVEQDAGQILFLFREEMYTPKEENKGLAEVIVAKNRNVPTGEAVLRWIPEQNRFANADTDDIKAMKAEKKAPVSKPTKSDFEDIPFE